MLDRQADLFVDFGPAAADRFNILLIKHDVVGRVDRSKVLFLVVGTQWKRPESSRLYSPDCVAAGSAADPRPEQLYGCPSSLHRRIELSLDPARSQDVVPARLYSPRSGRLQPKPYVYSSVILDFQMRMKLVLEAGNRRANQKLRAKKLSTSAPRTQCPTEALIGKVTKVLRLVGQVPRRADF
jgi:hypothetical protein